jgi:hypothetical protein
MNHVKLEHLIFFFDQIKTQLGCLKSSQKQKIAVKQQR